MRVKRRATTTTPGRRNVKQKALSLLVPAQQQINGLQLNERPLRTKWTARQSLTADLEVSSKDLARTQTTLTCRDPKITQMARIRCNGLIKLAKSMLNFMLLDLAPDSLFVVDVLRARQFFLRVAASRRIRSAAVKCSLDVILRWLRSNGNNAYQALSTIMIIVVAEYNHGAHNKTAILCNKHHLLSSIERYIVVSDAIL